MNDAPDVSHGPQSLDLLDLKRMLKALGDEARLHMLSLLAEVGETNVTDLSLLLEARWRFVSQPLVSWHISVLRRLGFVRTRRIGRLVYCSLDRGRYDGCLRMLGELTRPAQTPEAGASIANSAPASTAR
jgi:ArsR family transcriptional regulator, arsenate/arsenite/antimonite-responsive transcriptional repressor